MTAVARSFHDELNEAVVAELDTASRIGGEAEAARAGSSPPGRDFVPPPPPAPTGPPSLQTLKDRKRELDRQLRSQKRLSWWRRVRGLHWAWWAFFGGIASLFVLAQAALWFTSSMVRAATPASLPSAAVTPTSIVYRDRETFPNPLQRVKLSPEAATILGAHDSDGDGKMDKLDAAKSSVAVTQILESNDLCIWWVTVDAQFKPTLSQTPTPGAAKLAQCTDPLAAATTTTTVPAK